MANRYKATEVNAVRVWLHFFFIFTWASALAGLRSRSPLRWISDGIHMGRAAAAPSHRQPVWSVVLFQKSVRTELTPFSAVTRSCHRLQITNAGSISLSATGNLVYAVTLLTINKEVAHCCSVYLLKYCYFKNTLLSSKHCPLLSSLSELCFLMTILEICKSFLRT